MENFLSSGFVFLNVWCFTCAKALSVTRGSLSVFSLLGVVLWTALFLFAWVISLRMETVLVLVSLGKAF